METNFGVEAETRQTGKLRSKFEHERKFLSKFYKRNHIPTKTELSVSIIFMLIGILLFLLYSDLNRGFYFLIACAIIASLSTIIRYFKNKKG